MENAVIVKMIGGPADGKWLIVDERVTSPRCPGVQWISVTARQERAQADTPFPAQHAYMVAGDLGIYMGEM